MNKEFYKEIEYNMSAEQAKALLKTRKGTELNMRPQDFLCKYVNESCNLRGYCVAVTTTL